MRPGKQQIAYHEAGHTVIARVLGVAVLRVGVLFSRPGYDTGVVETADPKIVNLNITALQTHTKITLAGPQAEHRHRPLSERQQYRIRKERSGSWENDWEEASRYVMTMVMLQHERKLPAEFDPSYRAEAEALFDSLLAETGALVARHWAAIDRVATALLNSEVSGTCRDYPKMTSTH